MNTTSEMLPEVRGRLGERLGIVCTCNKKINTITTVREALKKLKGTNQNDKLCEVYPHHTEHVQKLISLIPKNGGSRESGRPTVLGQIRTYPAAKRRADP